jgi:hypothetical protein
MAAAMIFRSPEYSQLGRFVQHILPLGFVRIRQWGFLATPWADTIDPG